MVELNGRKIFSKLDWVKEYHQIPIHSDDREKTAVITTFGLFEFIRMPFGLKKAGNDISKIQSQNCSENIRCVFNQTTYW